MCVGLLFVSIAGFAEDDGPPPPPDDEPPQAPINEGLSLLLVAGVVYVWRRTRQKEIN